jgi:type IV pilus biogenesis protein CpaD/CtpE
MMSLASDVAQLLAGCRRGMTAYGAAAILRSTSTPAPHHVAAVAEELDALVAVGQARRVDGQRRLGHGGRADTMWFSS